MEISVWWLYVTEIHIEISNILGIELVILEL